MQVPGVLFQEGFYAFSDEEVEFGFRKCFSESPYQGKRKNEIS